MLVKFAQTIFILILLFVSIDSNASGSISFQYGAAVNNHPTLKEYDVSSNGFSHLLSAGMTMAKLELDLYFGQTKNKAKINHDNVENTINTDIQRFGIGAMLFATSRLYFVIGIGRATINQELENSVDASTTLAIDNIYKLQKKEEISELRYGLAFQLFNMAGFSFYWAADHYSYSRIDLSDTILSFGIKTRL